MEDNKTSSSDFSREEKLELCVWLEIGMQRLDKLIENADVDDLRRLKTMEGKDAIYDSILHKVDMKHVQPDMAKIAGGCVADGSMPGFDPMIDPRAWHYGNDDEIIYIEKAMTEESCDEVKKYYLSQGSFSPVGVQGMQNGADAVGSNRITCWDEEFAREMFIIIHDALDSKKCNRLTSTDWWQYNRANALIQFHSSHAPHVSPRSMSWKPVGVTPMVRFMNYQGGGEHYAHYDAGYIYDNPNYRTLMSGVLYLTSNTTGATRFIKDGQEEVDVWNRKHEDHQDRTKDEDVQRLFYPDKGSILLFDHRLCHDVQLYDGKEGDRTIIRFDVVFEANL